MRIVVSGTHASGKSTLVADFCAAHPEFDHLPDPFELLDEFDDQPGASSFLTQLAASARRLEGLDPHSEVIAERGPLDFLAYLVALESLGRVRLPEEVIERAEAITRAAMQHVDLVLLLPLNSADEIWVHPEEDLSLRAAMNDALLELGDDPELIGDRALTVELTGDRQARLRALESAIDQLHGR